MTAEHAGRADNAGRWLAAVALAVVTSLLLLGAALLPAGALWHPDEGAKLLQLYNLRFDGLLLTAPIAYPGRDLDPGLEFVPFHPKQYRVDAQGEITLQWPIFLAALTAPFYALLGMAGLYAWPLLGALASCLLAWRLALAIGTPPRWAWLAIPMLGLATPLGFYSWLFFEHTLASALVAGAVLLLLRGRVVSGQWSVVSDGRRAPGARRRAIQHGGTRTRRGNEAGSRGLGEPHIRPLPTGEDRGEGLQPVPSNTLPDDRQRAAVAPSPSRGEGWGEGQRPRQVTPPPAANQSIAVTPAPGSRLPTPAYLAASGLLLGLAIYLRSELYVLAAVCATILAGQWLKDRRQRATPPTRPDHLDTYTTPFNDRRPATGDRQPAPGSRLPAPVPWLAGLLLALLPLWIYHALEGGGILPYHATWYFAGGEPVGGASGPRLPEIRYLAQVGWGIIPAFLAGPDNAGGPTIPGLLSLAIVLAALLALGGALLPWLRPHDTRLRVAADWLFLSGLIILAGATMAVLLSPEPYVNLHGFLLAAPAIALAALAGRPNMPAPAKTLALLVLLYIVGHVLVISALSGLGPISTYEWGQRYILPVYSLLVPLAVLGSYSIWRTARGRLLPLLGLISAVLLVLIGAGFLLRGWLALDAGKRDVAAWQSIVAANADPAVITGDWWLPLLLAPDFNNHRWYLVDDQAELGRWLAEVAQQRMEVVALASAAADPVGDYMPVIEVIEGPNGFRLVRYAAIAR